MARKILFISFAGIISIALYLSSKAEAAATTFAQSVPVAAGLQEQIMGATVGINMVREEIREKVIGLTPQGSQRISQIPVTTVADGIGTLLTVQGQVVLVTHNHWPQVVDASKPDRVRFTNGAGELLMEIDGTQFRNNILFRDGGTLVMQAPAELLLTREPVAGVSLSDSVAAGSSVQLVRRSISDRTKLELMAAQVTAINEAGEHTVITLQNANGQSIEPGDSGGGIWAEGELVGNIWSTIREELVSGSAAEPPTIMATDKCRAAGLTDGLMSLLAQSLSNLEKVSEISGEFAME